MANVSESFSIRQRNLAWRFNVVAIVAMLLQCLLLATLVHASIKVNDKEFPSWEEKKLGHRLWKGYQYMGRLQYVESNLHLCQMTSDVNHRFPIVPSTDGIPVALYAKDGGCSLEEKAMVASKLITPANHVAYLIVDDRKTKRRRADDGEDRHQEDEEAEEDTDEDDDASWFQSRNILERRTPASILLEQVSNDDEAAPALSEEIRKILYANDLGTDDAATTTMVDTDDASVNDDETVDLGVRKFVVPEKSTWSFWGSKTTSKEDGILDHMLDHRFLKHSTGDDEISVYVLHITSNAGYEILNMLLKESNDVRSEGGPKIILNSKEPTETVKTFLVWALLTVVISGSCCLCALTVISPEEENAPPPRPRPRRLTNAQVREKFPALHYDPANHVEQPLDDECVICLDDFEEGMLIRQLPCGHIFHSPCIARWLVERSATCPLCKADFFEEIVEQDGGEEATSTTPPPLPPPTTTARVLRWVSSVADSLSSNSPQSPTTATNGTTGNMPSAPPANAFRWSFARSPSSAAAEGETNGPTPAARSPRGWFRRFRRIGAQEGLQTELTEPLMSSEADDAEAGAVTTSPSTNMAADLDASQPVEESTANSSSRSDGTSVPSAEALDRVESTSASVDTASEV